MSDNIIVCGGGESKPDTEYGVPPHVVDANHDCPECGKVHLLEECPDCGSNDIHYGYGIGIGPGMGQYKCCMADGCSWFWKLTDPDE